MNSTPNANRLHVAIFGRRNSGKSTLINAITGEATSVVSDIAGTTTDTVARSIELYGVGACLFIDTPGFDDDGELGEMRVERTERTLQRADIAMLLCEDGDLELERRWFDMLKVRSIPIILIINKIDQRSDVSEFVGRIEKRFGESPTLLSAINGVDIEVVRELLLSKISPDATERTITGDLVSSGDLVVLVMPQDAQAPKGRLILPQVQTLRELLDKGAITVSCTTEGLEQTLSVLSAPPKLIITDSQAFDIAYELTPQESQLTSFSVLMAGYKGDITTFIEGARAIESLTPSSKVLIAEGCAHAPLTEDIGRVKIPRLLRRKVGEDLEIDIVAGRNFPKDLTQYDMVIHCGGCMFNRKYVMSRVQSAEAQSIPITNYGVIIAHLNGILDRITYCVE